MNIYDIAREAGVSIATISRVINGKAVVSEKTKIRVQNVLEKYNYFPSEIARGLVLNSMRTVGIMTTDITDVYYAQVSYAVERELNLMGYTVLLCNTGDDSNENIKYLNTLRQKKVDGIILVGSVFQNEELESSITTLAQEIPVVMINGVIGAKNIYSVICDDYAGVAEAVEYLIKMNKTKPIYLQHNDSHSAMAKLEGFRKSIINNKASVEKDSVIKVNKGLDGGIEGIETAIEKGMDFDSVVCGDDIIAIGVLKALKKHGIKVPDKVSVIGFNNSILSQCCDPELTSIDSMMNEMGKHTVDILVKVMNGENIRSKYILKPKLFVRQST